MQLFSGVFERGANGGGMVRFNTNLDVGADDVPLTAIQQRKLNLRGGELLECALFQPKDRGHGKRRLSEVSLINGQPASYYVEVKPLDKLIPIDPNRQLMFETSGGPTSMRIIDLLTPIGFGQRGLIVAPPRTGKTIILKQMAQAVAANHPDVHVLMLLVDERPEEVTEMRRSTTAVVAASCNDRDNASHIRLARLAIDRARRMLETGADVVVLVDSLTRLGRAFNAETRGGGRIMSGGLDSRAMTEPKGIFGAARNIEDGGSLTIIATALIDTGSRMDEVIFNEFKGTGNMEIVLSRIMADRRVWPAIDVNASGTRKEELLLSEDALQVSHSLRRSLRDDPIRAMEDLLTRMERFESNAEFIRDVMSTQSRGAHRDRFR